MSAGANLWSLFSKYALHDHARRVLAMRALANLPVPIEGELPESVIAAREALRHDEPEKGLEILRAGEPYVDYTDATYTIKMLEEGLKKLNSDES